MEILTINGIEYIKKEDALKFEPKDIDKYSIIRTYSAGVFSGYISKREGQEVVIKNARRLYSWQGAATLSQLATEGTSLPEKCKFPCEVNEIIVTQVIEILTVTDKAKKSIESVPIWKV